MVEKNKFSDKALVFRDKKGKPFVMQSFGSLEELYKRAEQIEAQFKKFGTELEKLTGGKFKLGPTKEPEIAQNKINRDCHGKATLISDIVRAKIIVDSPEGIEEIINILDPKNPQEHKILKDFGAYCAQLNNHFSSPKLETGYRCGNAKISFPLDDKNGNKTGEEYLVELQIVHEAIEAVYDKTHKHMRQAQDIGGRFKHEQMPNEQAMRAGAHYAVCKFYNGQAARKAGLDRFLIKKSDALTSEKEDRLENIIKSHRLD